MKAKKSMLLTVALCFFSFGISSVNAQNCPLKKAGSSCSTSKSSGKCSTAKLAQKASLAGVATV